MIISVHILTNCLFSDIASPFFIHVTVALGDACTMHTISVVWSSLSVWMKVSSTSIVGLSKDLTHEIVNLKQINISIFTRTNNATIMIGKLTLDVQRYKFMGPWRHRGVTIICRAIVNPRMMSSCLCKSYSASCHFLISVCEMPCLQTN